jgi:hypothetical protein
VKLLGRHLMARDLDRHFAPVWIRRIAVTNSDAALGIPITMAPE